MAMAENENEIGAGPKSPWKTPADNAADCPIMTAEAWSELSNGISWAATNFKFFTQTWAKPSP